MIRIVDKNDKYVVQKIISQVIKEFSEDRDLIIETVLRYQVAPVDGIGNAETIRVCETLEAARKLMAA